MHAFFHLCFPEADCELIIQVEKVYLLGRWAKEMLVRLWRTEIGIWGQPMKKVLLSQFTTIGKWWLIMLQIECKTSSTDSIHLRGDKAEIFMHKIPSPLVEGFLRGCEFSSTSSCCTRQESPHSVKSHRPFYTAMIWEEYRQHLLESTISSDLPVPQVKFTPSILAKPLQNGNWIQFWKK